VCLLKSCSWLIAIAYWLAGGFIKSGLGNRIAYSMVAAFGKTTLGLTYSLVRGFWGFAC
jgi:di/tricarboxylate transporter